MGGRSVGPSVRHTFVVCPSHVCKIWPMGGKRGLGGKNVIEMTPPLNYLKNIKKIMKSKKKIYKHIYFWPLGKKLQKKSKLTKSFLTLIPFLRDSNSQTLATPYIFTASYVRYSIISVVYYFLVL